MSDHVALIVGVGPGLGSALARRFAADGFRVAIAARRGDTLQDLAKRIAGHAYTCDVSRESDVAGLFAAVERDIGTPNVVIHNASRRLRGPIDAVNPIEVEQTLRVTALGGFVGQAAARAMIPRGSGSIFFTGATASVKGFARSAAFAMGKFGLRGLAQSMARELAPQNIHVAHFVIDRVPHLYCVVGLRRCTLCLNDFALMQRRVAHLDMDAFYASVELLRYPQLRGLPVVIGGRHHGHVRTGDTRDFPRLRDYVGRGVVTTATYEARAFGVHSGTGIMKAARLAPDAILLPADFEQYRHYSHLFKAAVAEIAPEIEDRGIDEIYIDLTKVAYRISR